jgi:hypothetical protein
MLSSDGPAQFSAGVFNTNCTGLPVVTAATAHGRSRFDPRNQTLSAAMVGLLLNLPRTAVRYSMNLRRTQPGRLQGMGRIEFYPAMQLNGLQPPTTPACWANVPFDMVVDTTPL